MRCDPTAYSSMLPGSVFPVVLHTTQCFHVPVLLNTWKECGKAQNSAKPGINKITESWFSSFNKLNCFFKRLCFIFGNKEAFAGKAEP